MKPLFLNSRKVVLSASQDGFKDGLTKPMLITISRPCKLTPIKKTSKQLLSMLPKHHLLQFSETELSVTDFLENSSMMSLPLMESQLSTSKPKHGTRELLKQVGMPHKKHQNQSSQRNRKPPPPPPPPMPKRPKWKWKLWVWVTCEHHLDRLVSWSKNFI